MADKNDAKASPIKTQKWHYVKTTNAAKARDFFGKPGSTPVRRRDEVKGLPTFAVWSGDTKPGAEDEPGVGENPGEWHAEPETEAPASEPVVDVDAIDKNAN